jgi:hypothetical protein
MMNIVMFFYFHFIRNNDYRRSILTENEEIQIYSRVISFNNLFRKVFFSVL